MEVDRLHSTEQTDQVAEYAGKLESEVTLAPNADPPTWTRSWLANEHVKLTDRTPPLPPPPPPPPLPLTTFSTSPITSTHHGDGPADARPRLPQLAPQQPPHHAADLPLLPHLYASTPNPTSIPTHTHTHTQLTTLTLLQLASSSTSSASAS
jgi:hypothetical protein